VNRRSSFLRRGNDPRPTRLTSRNFSQLTWLNTDHSRSLVDDEGGASVVEGTSDLSAAGVCAALSLGGAPSRASRNVFFTSCQNLLVNNSFIPYLAPFHHRITFTNRHRALVLFEPSHDPIQTQWPRTGYDEK
jgi:hypothetical protein